MYSATTSIRNDTGLHARPAAEFIKKAKSFSSSIQISRVNDTGCEAVNAKSMVKVLTFGACKGESIKITAEGVDEKAAVAALIELIEREFDEA